jgi:hypothetical protein
MTDLNITIIQSDLHWEDIGANLAMFEEKIWGIGGNTDVIILPEMFTTGFTMAAPRLAEVMNMRTTRDGCGKWPIRRVRSSWEVSFAMCTIAFTTDCCGWNRVETSEPTTSVTSSGWQKNRRPIAQAKVF